MDHLNESLCSRRVKQMLSLLHQMRSRPLFRATCLSPLHRAGSNVGTAALPAAQPNAWPLVLLAVLAMLRELVCWTRSLPAGRGVLRAHHPKIALFQASSARRAVLPDQSMVYRVQGLALAVIRLTTATFVLGVNQTSFQVTLSAMTANTTTQQLALPLRLSTFLVNFALMALV